MSVQPPDLPDLEPVSLSELAADGTLVLDGVLVELADSDPLQVRRVSIMESELHGVTLRSETPGLQLRDVVVRGCDFSNLNGRGGSLGRVEIHGSRLLGIGLPEGDAQDLRVVDSSLALASFESARLRNVVFERVDLTDASFMQAHLNSVEFIDCKLGGADFRRVKATACAIRGASLDGVLGVDALKGFTMPWLDVLDSAGALADALGITVESDQEGHA